MNVHELQVLLAAASLVVLARCSPSSSCEFAVAVPDPFHTSLLTLPSNFVA